MNDEDAWTDDEETIEKKIERINRLSLSELKDIITVRIPSFSFSSTDGRHYPLSLYNPQTIPKSIFQGCFKVLEGNVKSMYKASSWGWSKRDKRAEMLAPSTRYLALEEHNTVQGFVTWQVEIEENEAVIYCYEVHLDASSQRKGFGRQFMEVLEHLGTTLNLSKVMLTVFTFNTPALSFYSKLGYTPDAISPQPTTRTSRRATKVIQPDYQILSKRLI